MYIHMIEMYRHVVIYDSESSDIKIICLGMLLEMCMGMIIGSCFDSNIVFGTIHGDAFQPIFGTQLNFRMGILTERERERKNVEH